MVGPMTIVVPGGKGCRCIPRYVRQLCGTGGDMLVAVYWVVREWVVERPSEFDAIYGGEEKRNVGQVEPN